MEYPFTSPSFASVPRLQSPPRNRPGGGTAASKRPRPAGRARREALPRTAPDARSKARRISFVPASASLQYPLRFCDTHGVVAGRKGPVATVSPLRLLQMHDAAAGAQFAQPEIGIPLIGMGRMSHVQAKIEGHAGVLVNPRAQRPLTVLDKNLNKYSI